MTPIVLSFLVFAGAFAFGRWRKFNSIQWIWLLFGSAIALVVVWALLLIFVVGPGMVETDTPW